jgi:hypothetical protein
MRKLQLAILAVALAAAMSASATMILVTSPGGEQYRSLSPGSEGFTFTTAAVLSNPIVTQLGIYDLGNNDLAASHVVTLFDAIGNVLASATIPANSFTPADHWQWVNTTAPVTLAPSTTYVLVAYYRGNDPDPSIFGSATLPAGFSLDYAVLGAGSGTPVQVVGSEGQGFFGPNLSFSISTVPEPTTMIAGALLLLPFGASTLRILRKNRTA